MIRNNFSTRKTKSGVVSSTTKGEEVSWREKRQKYLSDKSKDLVLPTAAEANLEPRFIFDSDTFVIHLCFECRQNSRKLEAIDIDDEHQKLELVLCRICRSNFNIQRRSKFFNHELMIFKKSTEEDDK
ncbi:hypothetical protein CAEBREN_00719 [Caenorhabditis brenneri]|uniref:Uncharacterized protein n=1 Tax=Caenorhabditis brenneri TaxID=135651 RepID=G0ME67_CAEBE|nr:hypothetical protein CAEBREN_00719 [Caenorhabditis brenneri]